MSKKFTKTIGAILVGSSMLSFGSSAAELVFTQKVGDSYEFRQYDNNHGEIVNINDGKQVIGAIDIVNGAIASINTKEVTDFLGKEKPSDKEIYDALSKLTYSIYTPELKKENLSKLTDDKIQNIAKQKAEISNKFTSKTITTYNSTVKSGGSSGVYLKLVNDNPELANEYNRIVTNMDAMNSDVESLNKETTFELDDNGNITLDETGSGDRESVKNVVSGIQADTTIHKNDDGSYTMDPWTKDTARVNEAVVDLDTRTRSNTKAIQSNSRQLQEHNARLNSQQRQIRENHEEMKRAAAQSAALSGLFQPYSVGKFNATAALGGYSDKQAVAVGVGYRFNEQTAAKAGIAASEGDVSYNVGVNFEF